VAPARLNSAARAVKRTCDLVLGGLMLLVAIPVLAAAAIGPFSPTAKARIISPVTGARRRTARG
jgi:hypothetical protein